MFLAFANSLKNINNNIDQDYKIVELISDQIHTNKELDNSKEITHPENQERILQAFFKVNWNLIAINLLMRKGNCFKNFS